MGILLLALLVPYPAAANGPIDRSVIIQVDKTSYIWAVGAWNFEYCRILTDNIDIIPQREDIKALCGASALDLVRSGAAWLYYIGEYNYKEDTLIELPPIEIIIDYIGSSVNVTATDPLPGEFITKIEVNINDLPALCTSSSGQPGKAAGSLACSFPVYRIPAHITITAVSSYGDTSKTHELRIDNIVNSDHIFSRSGNNALVLGDIAYTKYNIFYDIPLRWGAVPSDPVPGWLRNLPTKELETDHYYYYLAGQILLEGLTTARDCNNSGISGQYANNCGVLAAVPITYIYQNAHDKEITAAAAAYGVPNALIKRIIAVESQFYPGALGNAGENGLYQITRDGADTLLRWNGAAYLDICGQYFNTCNDVPYDNLDPWQRDLLANHILNNSNNIYYLAAALKANAYQVDKILDNLFNITVPGDYFSYAELWQISIGNYHTGPTVTAAVFGQIQQTDQDINFTNYLAALENVLPSGSNYISMVTKGY